MALEHMPKFYLSSYWLGKAFEQETSVVDDPEVRDEIIDCRVESDQSPESMRDVIELVVVKSNRIRCIDPYVRVQTDKKRQTGECSEAVSVDSSVAPGSSWFQRETESTHSEELTPTDANYYCIT